MDARKIIESLTRNPGASSAFGGLAGSLLGGVLMGGGRKPGKLMKYGGLAAVGYIAYQAYQRNQAQKAGQPVPPWIPEKLMEQLGLATGAGTTQAQGLAAPVPPAFDVSRSADASLKVIQAMVAAARSDGAIDASERQKIFDRVDQSGLAQEDQDYVMQLLTRPQDVDGVVRDIGTPELAAEVYAASALAVHPASRSERAYLDMLSARLGLDPALTAELDRGVEAAVGAGEKM